MDARVNTADDLYTSDKNSVNFDQVAPSFAGAFAQRGLYTLGIAAHF